MMYYFTTPYIALQRAGLNPVPACDAYVSAHRNSHLPMGTLADKSLRQKRRQAHIALNWLWEQGLMTRK